MSSAATRNWAASWSPWARIPTRINTVANGFAQATELLKSLGFGYLATYEKRRLVMEKL